MWERSHRSSWFGPVLSDDAALQTDAVGAVASDLGDCFNKVAPVVDEADAVIGGVGVGKCAVPDEAVEERAPLGLGVEFQVRPGAALDAHLRWRGSLAGRRARRERTYLARHGEVPLSGIGTEAVGQDTLQGGGPRDEANDVVTLAAHAQIGGGRDALASNL